MCLGRTCQESQGADSRADTKVQQLWILLGAWACDQQTGLRFQKLLLLSLCPQIQLLLGQNQPGFKVGQTLQSWCHLRMLCRRRNTCQCDTTPHSNRVALHFQSMWFRQWLHPAGATPGSQIPPEGMESSRDEDSARETWERRFRFSSCFQKIGFGGAPGSWVTF